MGRPPMAAGTHGRITARKLPAGTWRASANLRGLDGVTRRVERVGRTETVARANLARALAEATQAAGGVTGDTRYAEAAAEWLGGLAGRRADTTVDQYRDLMARHVLPAIGRLRLREVTTYRLDQVMRGLEQRGLSAATRRQVRKVISGPLAMAVRYDALPTNPVRSMDRVEGAAVRERRALTEAERTDLLRRLADDPAAVDRDVPELVRFMLGTGVRIGEALAVRWSDLDLDGSRTTPRGRDPRPAVEITGNVVRVRGHGLQRHGGKTATALRVLPLPEHLVTLLTARRDRLGVTALGAPVFATGDGGYRDPANVQRWLRDAFHRAGYGWLTTHAFRRTAALVLDEHHLTARQIADHLGHRKVSMTQDVYLPRGHSDGAAAAALNVEDR